MTISRTAISINILWGLVVALRITLCAILLNVIVHINCNAECYYAECNYAEFHYAECHSADCHYAEGHYAVCHYVECHFANLFSKC